MAGFLPLNRKMLADDMDMEVLPSSPSPVHSLVATPVHSCGSMTSVMGEDDEDEVSIPVQNHVCASGPTLAELIQQLKSAGVREIKLSF